MGVGCGLSESRITQIARITQIFRSINCGCQRWAVDCLNQDLQDFEFSFTKEVENLSAIMCFDSILVRLKAEHQMYLPHPNSQVSIPYWFD